MPVRSETGMELTRLVVLELAPGETYRFPCGDAEWIVLPLTGACEIRCTAAPPDRVPGPALDPGAALDPGPALDPGAALDPGLALDPGAALGPGPALGPALDLGAALG
ncbi:hypothetical protein ACFVHW_22345, partial [Streptomyces sp. NPDC127110]